jgi:hypothetical protein
MPYTEDFWKCDKETKIRVVDQSDFLRKAPGADLPSAGRHNDVSGSCLLGSLDAHGLEAYLSQ